MGGLVLLAIAVTAQNHMFVPAEKKPNKKQLEVVENIKKIAYGEIRYIRQTKANFLDADKITLNLIGEELEVKDFELDFKSGSKSISWTNGESSVILTKNLNDWDGQIYTVLHVYRITPLGDSLHALYKLDQDKFRKKK